MKSVSRGYEKITNLEIEKCLNLILILVLSEIRMIKRVIRSLDFEEVVKLDTQYINNWSIGLDLKTIFKTIMAILKRERSMY